jgi:hypothetical protein
LGLFALLLGLFTWGNYQFARQNPGGNDFLVHWVGTRALLLKGQTPYSDAVALDIQTRVYGRAAQPGEHELRPAYPLYSAILFAPFALIPDFTLARALWMTFLEAGLVGLTLLSLRLSHWQPTPPVLTALLLFSLTWYHGARPLINGNAVVWVALFLTLALWAIHKQRDWLAGGLAALATIKPHLALLLIAALTVWAILHKRWGWVGGLLITGLGLTVLAMFWVPAWPLQNWAEITRYTSYNPPTTPGAAFAQGWPAGGRWVGIGLSVIVALTLLREWGEAMRVANFDRLLWASALTLTLGQWSGLTTDPGNYVLLTLPLLLVLARLAQRWHGFSPRGVILALIGLFVGLWAIFVLTLETTARAQQSPLMFFPLPALLIVGLALTRPS